jgi:hypothetical protein
MRFQLESVFQQRSQREQLPARAQFSFRLCNDVEPFGIYPLGVALMLDNPP